MFLAVKSICINMKLHFFENLFALFGKTSKSPYIRQRNNCLTNI